jgi:hypothetical protein
VPKLALLQLFVSATYLVGCVNATYVYSIGHAFALHSPALAQQLLHALTTSTPTFLLEPIAGLLYAVLPHYYSAAGIDAAPQQLGAILAHVTELAKFGQVK